MATVEWLQPRCAAGSQSLNWPFEAVSARSEPCRQARRLAWNFTTEKRRRHWRRCVVGNVDVYVNVNVNVRDVTCDRNMHSLPTGSTWRRSIGAVCGYVRFCSACADTVRGMGNECPLCRTPIDMALRVFSWDCNVFDVLAESVSELCVLANFKRTLNTTDKIV